MPTAGKSFIEDKIDFIDVLHGSILLHKMAPAFDDLDESGKNAIRERLADYCISRDEFLMDGHYAFGEKMAFTNRDGNLYDAFIYIYVDPDFLLDRMKKSQKNQKYVKYDIGKWQRNEIDGLREYCHSNDKDFYVIDNPPLNEYVETSTATEFIQAVTNGYSCRAFAKKIANEILEESAADTIYLIDGDKTFIKEDSSCFVFGYNTNIFDGNFYTGFQTWEQYKEFADYKISIPEHIGVHQRDVFMHYSPESSFILSSGNKNIWKKIAEEFNIKCFSGYEMSAETKFFVTKILRMKGRHVIAFGDSMSDVFMLREADKGYIVRRDDESFSKSLDGVDTGGLYFV
jgi:hypothetical protein